MRICNLIALCLISPRGNKAQNLQDFLDAVESVPPGEVDDPLKSAIRVPGLSKSAYLSMIDSESCPAYQEDVKNVLDGLQLLDKGYPEFFESRAFPNGAVFGPGRCTTSFIGQEKIREELEIVPQLFDDSKIYRENSLGLLRFNDIIFKKGVWSDGYAGVALGIPTVDHNIVRPVMDYLFGDSQEGMSTTFSDSGQTWDSEYFFESAQTFLSEKNEVAFDGDAKAWVIKTFHEQIFGLSLSTEELQLFQILQGVFVVLSSINPESIELLYPTLNKLLVASAQDFFLSATNELSERLSIMMVELGEGAEGIEGVDDGDDIENIAIQKAVASLRNSMIEIQQSMPTLGEELDIAEEVIRMLYRLLSAIKDSYATFYYTLIRYGQIPADDGHSRLRASHSSDTLKYVKENILGGDPDKILKAAHAITDVFFFAGGLSAPSIITAAAGVYFGDAIENTESVDVTNETSLKLLVLEATRRFPPVLGVTYLERNTGQRRAPLPGMAGFDRSVYGIDVEKIKIRGDLSYYHRNSLNFAEPAGPLQGKPETSRICPGRSMSIAMATQFLKAMDLKGSCLKSGESVVFDEGGPTFFNDFTVTKICPSSSPSTTKSPKSKKGRRRLSTIRSEGEESLKD